MTLVVGYANREIGFLVGDTLLSRKFELKDHEGPFSGEFHALKIHILNGKVAVAYAGDFETSLNLINVLYSELDDNPDLDVGDCLAKSYSDIVSKAGPSPPDCEFLIFQKTKNGNELLFISKDGVSRRERAYIGDAAEYARMMALRKPYTPPSTQAVQQPDGGLRMEPLITSQGEVEFAEVANAMETLTHQRRSETVAAIAGNVVRVAEARISGELEYLQSGEASISPAEGKSGYSFLASNSNRRGIAIYYVSGKFGFLFIVGDFEPCRKEYAQTVHEFVEAAKTKYGLKLEGMT